MLKKGDVVICDDFMELIRQANSLIVEGYKVEIKPAIWISQVPDQGNNESP